MAKLTKTQLTNMRRDEILAQLVQFLTDEGEEVLRVSGNAIAFPTVDAEGNEIFAKLTLSIPRGDRSGEAYDAYGEAQQYQEHLEDVAANKARKEKEKQEAAKKRAEKAAAAKAKKEAEAAKRAESLAKQTTLGSNRKFIAELMPGDRFAYGQRDGVILSKNDETKIAQIQFDYEDKPSQLRYVAEVFI